MPTPTNRAKAEKHAAFKAKMDKIHEDLGDQPPGFLAVSHKYKKPEPYAHVTAEREVELRRLAALPPTGPNLAMVLVARDCIAMVDETRRMYNELVQDRKVQWFHRFTSVPVAMAAFLDLTKDGD